MRTYFISRDKIGASIPLVAFDEKTAIECEKYEYALWNSENPMYGGYFAWDSDERRKNEPDVTFAEWVDEGCFDGTAQIEAFDIPNLPTTEPYRTCAALEFYFEYYAKEYKEDIVIASYERA